VHAAGASNPDVTTASGSPSRLFSCVVGYSVATPLYQPGSLLSSWGPRGWGATKPSSVSLASRASIPPALRPMRSVRERDVCQDTSVAKAPLGEGDRTAWSKLTGGVCACGLRIVHREEWVREAATRAKRMERLSWKPTGDLDQELGQLTAHTTERRQLEKQVMRLNVTLAPGSRRRDAPTSVQEYPGCPPLGCARLTIRPICCVGAGGEQLRGADRGAGEAEAHAVEI
jgi:hypothetical protein